MFTGIIRHQGIVIQKEHRDGQEQRGTLFQIRTSFPLSSLKEGNSIAVDGACMTVLSSSSCPEDSSRTIFSFFASPETLSKTVMANFQIGTQVNLEEALRFGETLDGHLVTGHVDECGMLVSRPEEGEDGSFCFKVSPNFLPFLAPKGSVAINGISLTVNEVDREKALFTVYLIPYTLSHTNLGQLLPNAPVHLEADLIARYVTHQILLREK